MTQPLSPLPRPGDKLRLLQNHRPHGVIGDIFTIVSQEGHWYIMDRCGCPCPKDHNYQWSVDPYWFEYAEIKISEEELKSVKDLPSSDELQKFFNGR